MGPRRVSLRRALWVMGAILPIGAAASPGAAESTATIKAVVVKSWGGCSSDSLIWDDLNADWSQYGSVPISIDYSDVNLCDVPVTYDALVASRASVVILSDPAGGAQQYSREEIDALARYVAEGHNIIATSLTFYCGCNGVDNSGLGPIFGIRNDNTYIEQHAGRTFDVRWPNVPLFRDVPDPYMTDGYVEAEMPTDGSWSGNELTFGQLVALTPNAIGAVVIRAAQNHASIYMSHMPEYFGGTQDKQLFYNAIIYPRTD